MLFGVLKHAVFGPGVDRLIEMDGLSPIHWGVGHLAGLRGLRMEGYVRDHLGMLRDI